VKIAVVGAGLYGCVIATALARAGHRVDIFDRQPEILWGASRANQGRVHRGFHYPRSVETVSEAKAYADLFSARFRDAMPVVQQAHVYGLAPESQTSARDWNTFICKMGGWRDIRPPSWTRNVEDAIVVNEELVDVDRLRAALYRELALAHVRLRLRENRPEGELGPYDLAVIAAYGRGFPRPLQWEVVEVALFQLHGHHAVTSLVVLDGPFVSVDRLPNGMHMVYDVEKSVRARNVGRAPAVPAHLADLVDRGLVTSPESAHEELQRRAARFVPAIEQGSYEGSMFTVRAVLPAYDDTDGRPCVVERHGELIHVLPGKLSSCLAAADQVVRLCAVDSPKLKEVAR